MDLEHSYELEFLHGHDARIQVVLCVFLIEMNAETPYGVLLRLLIMLLGALLGSYYYCCCIPQVAPNL